MKKINVAQEALKMVCLNEEGYGRPEKSWEEIATIASILCRKELTAENCMIVLKVVKLVRESYKHKRDNLVDEIGYILLQERVRDGSGR